MNDLLNAGVVVCVLAGVGLAIVMGGLPTITGGDVALKDSDRVTAKAASAQGIATRAARALSGPPEAQDLRDARLTRSEPDTGLKDSEEVTLRASLEPVIEELALEESVMSPHSEEPDDPEEITRQASLEPRLEEL